MAVVVGFEKAVPKRPKRQPTDVIAHWSVLSDGGRGRILQLDTRGSESRAKPDKQSQTIQLTEDSARQLHEILGREFGF